ncbi:MAG: GNAT family N-acetyltransferase, partial [Thermoproteota archaeon]
FKEAGEEGRGFEREILEYKNHYNMRIIGPNSLGVMRPSINLNATFAKRPSAPGKIAFLSQSAALCASVLDWASEAHVGFSALVSVGSMVDVDFGDLIDYFGTDTQTTSIVLYLESVKNAQKFMSAARGFSRAKPIVVVKAGRFSESAQAALCHTGALCGQDSVYDAAFKRVGIVRVERIHDLFNCAEALAMQPNPHGQKLTIITNAGGPGIMATDLLIAKGGTLSQLSTETIQKLADVLPSYCSILNPIDVLEDATVERFKKVMKICLKDSESDGFLIIYTPQGAADPIETAQAIVNLSEKTNKPILTSLMGEDDCWKARRLLSRHGIPSFTTPEQGVSTFMYMHSYTKNLELLYETPEEFPIELTSQTSLKGILNKASQEERGVLSLPESLNFLEAYGIPTVETSVVKTGKEALEAASRLGYPVALKVLSPQITHKSHAKGVILNVWSPTQVKRAFDKITEQVKTFSPETNIEGVAVQSMVQGQKCELLIGSKRDPQFGSVIVFGSGGSQVDFSNDVNVGFPPLNQVLAKRLTEKSDVYKLLSSDEYSASAEVIEETLVKFSQLITDFPEIREMDINPLIVNREYAVAVDARIVVDPETKFRKKNGHKHLVIAPYPQKYVSPWELKDGTPVILRPVKPEDEKLLSDLFLSFSEQTMRFRFFQVIKNMSHRTLTRYCNIDYNREIAIVAEMKENDRKIIGVSRLILEPGRDTGEFAVVVADDWQGLGLGSKLVDYLMEIAKDMELETISGEILSNNLRMIRLCDKKGFEIEPVDEDTVKAVMNLS